VIDRQYLGRGLACVDSDRAWELREKLLAEGMPGGWILEGLAGMDSERAWEMRERFRSKGSGYDYISLGLSLLDTERAWKMRDDMINCPIKKTSSNWGLTDFFLHNGLSGCDSDRAWKLREEALARKLDRRALLPGAHGDWLIAANAIAQAEQLEAKTIS
jgi:hypothetical protein